MRLDDFSGHTKGVNLCKDHISHRWDLKLQWNMNVEKRFMDRGSLSLHLSSTQKWRTAVVLSSALLSLQEKKPTLFSELVSASFHSIIHIACGNDGHYAPSAFKMMRGAWDEEVSLKWEHLLSFKLKKIQCTLGSLDNGSSGKHFQHKVY